MVFDTEFIILFDDLLNGVEQIVADFFHFAAGRAHQMVVAMDLFFVV